jgi:SpoVK/Ycf46/Vps4 family AAA+-type ATPase
MRGEADRSERLADLVFSQRLLAGQRRTALLFDEMEDVAVHLLRRGGSKVYLNRLLETNAIPIIWTSNELQHIDPALLRRMTLAVELRRPPASQRKRILERLVKRVGLALSDAEIEGLARRVDATPAILENALRAAKLAGGGADAIERAALGIVRAVSGVIARKPGNIPDFDPLLSTASQDLGLLADKLVSGRVKAFSICLSGPPGTGKSAFARYLARRLGLELVQKRASDILGPYLGQTERSIAVAFEEAVEANAVLVFDEADSLLLDRRDATRSWEISQVNEMLTWMEEHPLPVFFTTNIMERVDTASLRRFTFHIVMRFLDTPGLRRAWQVFFAADRVPAEGLGYANLTPGDFVKVRKQAEVLGVLDQPVRLAEMLGDVSRAKPDASGSLGFVT